jgi:uncharacterized protein (DUF2336 family)
LTTIETAPGLAEAAPGKAAEAHLSSPRELLVRKLIDIVVLPAARISANERSLAADVLLQVVDKVEETLRIEIARRVARVPEAPPALLRMLLLDEPTVAEPVIRHADALPEALLIECAQQATTAHREMIARRIDLTPSVADALIAFDEPDIARLLLRREEFALSPSAIDVLVARSTTDKDLQTLLLRRREIEPAHGFMMFWWVGPEQRRRILARFSLSRGIIQDAIEDLYPKVFRKAGVDDPFVKELLVMLDRRHRPRGVNGEAVSMDIVKKTLAASRAFPSQEIAHAVSMIAGVSRELAARILRDPGGEPYAIMCKSLGVPRDDFYGFVSKRDPDTDEKAHLKRAEDLLAVFDSMARDFARAVLRYWDWDGNPRIARITRLLGVADA